ncbi:unnamed protein product [Rotaria magnacalcarata]|uniref:Ig-like domain-containing protein n=1 Tax=Rotaria magnacalcarata TaxID=392030 RepID=A0A8S2N4W2_9BILA|nr:unnamed protein product [Rotaria magnacalcarata]
MLIYYLLFLLKLTAGDKNCFQQPNDINYLFLNDMSQIKIPLIPRDCIHCQSAYQVDIQLIDEQFVFGNRTIQRIKIFLKNFEIEDSSYICLINICPIIVEYGSDTILLNVTSSLFSHVFLSLTYINTYNHSITCSIQTRFAIFSLNKFLTCTDKIYLHPRLNIEISAQIIIYDCRAYLFEKNVYEKSIQFYRKEFSTNKQILKIKSSSPIDGSKEFLKYVWYYQRYQPRYQISNNRTILLSNITEQMQGKYMCVGDDENEKLEFEMILHVSKNNSFYFITILILIGCLIILALILTLIICFILNKSSSSFRINEKRNSLLIHHDVRLTIQHSNEQQLKASLWNQAPYHTLDYIDEQSLYHMTSKQLIKIPSWLWKKQQLLQRFSTRQRNLNGQSPSTELSANIPRMKSNSDIKFPFLVKFHQISDSINNSLDEQHNNVEILKISVPFLDQYPLVKPATSIVSFDSQNELEEFNQMTSVCTK